MPTAEKVVKETTQTPVAKKEGTDHKCLWQRKKAQGAGIAQWLEHRTRD